MIGRVPGIQLFERCQSMICHARKSPRHAEIFQCLSDRIGSSHCDERNIVSRTDAAKNLSLSSNNISDSDADQGLRTTNRHRCEGSTGAQITEGHRPYALTQTKNFAGGGALPTIMLVIAQESGKTGAAIEAWKQSQSNGAIAAHKCGRVAISH